MRDIQFDTTDTLFVNTMSTYDHGMIVVNKGHGSLFIVIEVMKGHMLVGP